MATRLKSTDFFIKFVAIVLSVICMAGAFWCASFSVFAVDLYGIADFDDIDAYFSNEKRDFTESHRFYSEMGMFCNDLSVMLENGITKLDCQAFDDAIENSDISEEMPFYTARNTKALRFYAVNGKNGDVLTNFKPNDNIETLLTDKQYAVVLKNGKTKYSKAMPDMWSDLSDYMESENCDMYLYIDTDAVKNADSSDYFGTFIQYCNYISGNLRSCAIWFVLLLIASIGLAIFVFSVCGVKLDNGKVKQLFPDYIPVDLHLGIIGVLIGLLVFGIYAVYDELVLGYYYSYSDFTGTAAAKYGMIIGAVCAGAIWMLFIEFMTSLIRVCRSGRKWYTCSLGLLAVYGLFLLTKLEIKGLVKLHKRNKRRLSSLKQFLGYHIKSFKKQLIFALIGYAFINLLLLLGIFCAAFLDSPILALLVGLIMFGINTASVVLVSMYVVSLDRIIAAAAEHSEPQVNYNKLPQSLRILVDSLHYSNRELQSAINKAVRDERLRSELITNVSHDLKTPLTSIITYVDLLKGCNITEPDAAQYISVLDEKGGKLKRLIDDLIEASKVTSGVITLAPISLDLSELATQAVVEHQQEFSDNNLELIFKGDVKSVTAYADGNKTFRVIENLLSNARKYSAKGTRVYADVYEKNNTAIFEIKNISAEPLDISEEELKERFVRGDKSRTNEGNGLGLSIADNLCKAMGGRLDIIIDGDLFKAKVILPLPKPEQ